MNVNENLHEFLRRERPKAVGYLMKHYGLGAEDAEDCYQEGSVAMWRNIHDGRLTAGNLTCSLSTYLISCCCNHASHLLRDRANTADLETREYRLTEDGEIAGASSADDGTEEREEMLRVMQEVVQDMSSPCREILWGMYYDKLKQDVIAKMLGLKNAETVKSQKVRCMKQLKERMYSIFNVH